MNTVGNYIVVKNADAEAFVREVVEWINKGWKLQGGVSIAPFVLNGEQVIINAQALVRG